MANAAAAGRPVNIKELPVPDEELARQARAGSFDAFEALVLRYEIRIYRFVLQRCGHETDAREITQDTFVRVFQALGRYDPRHPFASWLFTIARNKAIDHHRRKPEESSETGPEQVDSEDPAELAARREDASSIWEIARRELSARQFEALWLRYAEEMPLSQVAKIQGMPQTYVKVSLFRARKTLARAWRQRSEVQPFPAEITKPPATGNPVKNTLQFRPLGHNP